MKKLLFLSCFLTLSLLSIASELFLMPTGSVELTKSAFRNSEFRIHYYNDHFIIGTTTGKLPANSILLDQEAWSSSEVNYFLIHYNPDNRAQYLGSIGMIATVLYEADDFLVVSAEGVRAASLLPDVHGGIIRISNKQAQFPAKKLDYTPGSLSFRDEISDMISQVDIDTLEAFVQHLQDFGTRNAYKAGGIQAQNWIQSKFQSYGLEVELHDFSMPGGAASDNVIATLTGSLYPEEYVILGAHYDSYAGSNNEPGADDNATGAAGILEAARIMSQYQFDRTIIFATWSGEEYGLYGSGAWAGEAADNGMNILGYFNIDMAGYLQAGDEIHTDIIAPSSANELRQFYKDVCALYLPDFQVFDGSLSGGDSDHTSFNENGYQGIFPFEDSQDYSPYIHTSNDLIGPSVNNFEQHMTFVKAIVANVASMASQLPTPENLEAQAGDQQVDLAWDALDGVLHYNIYRNNEPEPNATSIEPVFTDTDVVNGMVYTYYVTAVYEDSGEESGPSNQVSAVPMPPITFPFYDDFETGAHYWTMEDSWGLQTGTYHSAAYSMTESPTGNYAAGMDASTTLRALNLTGATSAELSFWTRYNTESGYDFMYLLVSADGTEWDQIDVYSGAQNEWVQKTYPLDDYIGQAHVQIRFRFTSDDYIEAQGMFIDDFEVNVSGVGVDDAPSSAYNTNLQFSPNPASKTVAVNYWLENSGMVKITLADSKGIVIKALVESWKQSGGYKVDLSVGDLEPGVYFGTLQSNGQIISRKLVITN
jgi:hypothetical protein